MGVFNKLLILTVCYLGVRAQDPVVTIAQGSIRGRTIELKDPKYNGIEVDSFYNIPFGDDTGGANRFKWPSPAPGWTGTRDGTVLGPACPQFTGPNWLWFTHPFWSKYSEDCLNLNVHAPTNKAGGPYPVMIFWHGGAYVTGFNSQYMGHFLAANDVIFIAANYRLDAFGFLSAQDPTNADEFYSEAPGNAGMMDQQLALEWIRDNIAAFGGDPTRVTIFGQSAGSSSTSLHMMSPKSTGLFHRAICESGSEKSFWAVNWPEQDPNNYGRQVAERLGCPSLPTESIAMIDCLRNYNWTYLQQNSNISCSPGHFCQGFAPIVDGPGGFLPDYPANIRRSGNWNKVPIITGSTREDGSLYTLFLIPESNEPGREGFTHNEFHGFLRNSLLYQWADSFTKEEGDKLFNALDWFYTPWPELENIPENRLAFNRLITDGAFGVPADSQARAHWNESDTYVYLLAMRPEHTSDIFPEWMGLPHSGELPPVFGWPLLKYNDEVRLNCEIYIDIINWTCSEDVKWAYFFQELWTNFAKHGNPTPPGSNVLVPDTVAEGQVFTWDKYEVSHTDPNGHSYMFADSADIHVGRGYRQREFAFWREYMTFLGDAVSKHNPGNPGPGPHPPRTRRSSPRSMKMGWYNAALAKHMEKTLRKRFGHDEFERLLKQSYEVMENNYYLAADDDPDWQAILQALLSRLPRDCDGNLMELPFTLPPFTLPGILP